MRKERINETHEIVLYQSAEELPINNYSKFQKYLLIDAGIGSDISAVSAHFSKMFQFLGLKMVDEALDECKNLYYNFFLMLESASPSGLAFCCLIHSVNGEPISDTSEASLKELLFRLGSNGLSEGTISRAVTDVKKKLIRS